MACGSPRNQRDTSGSMRSRRRRREKNKTGRRAGLPLLLDSTLLFIVSVNSEACLNSEMNLWINTIMVIWHPLWMPLRVFVCPPAALEAGQTFWTHSLSRLCGGSLGLCHFHFQFQFQFQPHLARIISAWTVSLWASCLSLI